MTDELDDAVLDAAVAADEDFLSRIASDAVSWDTAPDELSTVFAALRADVGARLPLAASPGTTVVPLSAARRRKHARRAAVAAGISLVVLSASGVAAAGTLSTHRADVGHSVYTFFHGETGSERAAERTARLLDEAEADLAASPLTLGKAVAARGAVQAARRAFGHVDPADAGRLGERIADVGARVDAAIAALTVPSHPGSGAEGEIGDHHGSSGDDGGSGGATRGETGDEHGSGDGTSSGSGTDGRDGGTSSGSDDGGTSSGSDGGGASSGSDDGSMSSGSTSDGSTSSGSLDSGSDDSSGSGSGSMDGSSSSDG